MKKVVGYAILLLAVGLVWWWYGGMGKEIEQLSMTITAEAELGDPHDVVPALKNQLSNKEMMRVFNGILLAFLSAGLVGIVFVVDILPMIAHRATHAIYDSAEMVEKDIMHDARSLFAQGDFEASIREFRKVAQKQPENRFPWVEIAKIQSEYLHDPAAAIATLREALEQQEWDVEDAAFFMFRLVELYDVGMEDRENAKVILEQVIEIFPDTRHAGNARHKLTAWEEEALIQAANEPPA